MYKDMPYQNAEQSNLSAIAINLYKRGNLTLEKSAKLADQSIEAFMEKLSELDIPTVDYPASDIATELKSIV